MNLTAELMARFLAAAVRFSGLPAVDPLSDGVERLLPAIRALVTEGGR